jgi:hypothetical protein
MICYASIHLFPSLNFLTYIRIHWYKAYDECLSEERSLCLWNPTVFLSPQQKRI